MTLGIFYGNASLPIKNNQNIETLSFLHKETYNNLGNQKA